MSFEADYVQSTLGAVRHWMMTGKIRSAELVAARQAGGQRALAALDAELDTGPFLVGATYSVADIAIYAYAHLAEEAGVSLSPCSNVVAWVDRVRAQSRHLAQRYGYDIDPHSGGELP